MASTVERDLEMDNARLGAIYFLANLKTDGWDVKQGFEAVKDAGKGAGAATTVAKATSGPADAKAAAPASGIREMAARTAKEVVDYVIEQLQKLFKYAKELLIEAASAVMAKLPELLTTILAEAANITKDLDGVRKGLVQAVTKGIDYIALQRKGKGVVMEAGHPDIIAKAIESAVKGSAMDGLRNALIAGAKAAFAGVTAGIGEIVNKIAGVLESVIKYVVRYCEARTMRRIIDDSKQMWAQKDQPLDSQKFTTWFRQAVDDAPIVAALVMNCGVAGDAMRFLRMTTPEGSVVTEGQFAKGADFLTALKSEASELIRGYDVPLTSDAPMVKSLLNHAGEIGLVQKEANSGWRAWLYKKTATNKVGRVGSMLGMKQSTPLAVYDRRA